MPPKKNQPATLDKPSEFIVAGALALLSCLPFLATPGFQFLNWDDDFNVVRNRALQLPWTTFLPWAWKTQLLGVYQPIAWILFRLQAGPGTLSPNLFHSVNVILHGANAALVFLCAREAQRLFRIFDASSRIQLGATALACFLFSLHPLRAEVVSWVSCQPYLLAIALALTSLFLYTRHLRLHGKKSRQLLHASIAAFSCAVLTKTVVILLPIVFLALRREARDETWKESLKKLAAFWSVAAIAGLAGWIARDWNTSAALATSATTPTMWIGAPFAYASFWFGKTLIPWALSPLYPLAGWFLDFMWVWLGVIALLLFKGTGQTLRAIGLLVVLASPTFLAAMSERLAFADRFSYFPMAIGSVIFALYSSRLWKPLHLSVGTAWVLVLGVWSYQTTQVWRSSDILWTYALSTSAANSAKTYTNLFSAYMDRGQTKEACEGVRKGLLLDGSIPELHNDLGLCLIHESQPDAAREAFSKVIALHPRHAEAHNNLAYLLHQRGDFEAALKHVEQAISIDSQQAKSHEMRARVLASMNRLKESLLEWDYVVQSNPSDAESHRLYGRALAEAGHFADAEASLREALRLRPNDETSRRDLETLQRHLASKPKEAALAK